MGYLEARHARSIRNNDNLKNLADKVIAKDNSIEVYHNKNDNYIESIVFFKGEEIVSIGFHSVPFRWSGPPNFREFPKEGKRPKDGELEMPFTVEDVINGFSSIKNVRHRHDTYFKSKKEYLDWCSYLVRYTKEN